MDPNNEQPQDIQPTVQYTATPPPTIPEVQATIKKNRKPLIIAIIAIVVSGLLFVGGFVIFIIFLALDSQNANEGTTQPSASYQTYHNQAVSFDYPTEWKVLDVSSKTRIVGGQAVTDQATIVSSKDNPHAVVDYSMQGKSTTPVAYSKRLSVMTESVTGQQQLSSSQLLATRTTAGHGCINNAEYIEQPKLVEREKLVGLQYTYACTSAYGPSEGAYMVWYDENGNKHSLTVSILKPVDTTYNVFSSHIIDSIKVI